ncbi:hypothetical protein QNA19_13405 [Rhodococcus fascians]|uniref:hypothetical protein n=1 Tax=Rhodococcoides fascians TaxID=1828 RepID=UPI001A22FBB8|nr:MULTISPECIES: hypothetical protein [Rhodococcus]MBJ7325322.1 hypothetical protein [Rhodococcus sp. (in: high G+C Gram-positive bacteria)]MDJ0426924.1 hypothetical protein [Rhodococcus fascians]
MAAPLINSSQIPAPIKVGSRIPRGTSIDRIIAALEPLGGKVTRVSETSARIDAGNIAIYRMLGTSLALGRRNLPIAVSIDFRDQKPSVSVTLRDTIAVVLRVRSEGEALNERVAEINELLDVV